MGYSRSAALKRAAEAREISRRVRAERRAAREARSAARPVISKAEMVARQQPETFSPDADMLILPMAEAAAAPKPKKPRKVSTKKSTKKTTKKS